MTTNTLARVGLLTIATIAAFVPFRGTSAQTELSWPQWRGDDRTATIRAGQLPKAWPAAFNKTWTVAVGEGYSSPVVGAGLAFIHSRKDPQEVVTAVDLRTGAVKWQQSYAAAINKNQYAVKMGKGPNATPLLDSGRLFTLGANGQVRAYDAATGKPLWTKDFSSRVDTSKLFCGTAASPLITNGSVIIQVGSDVHGGIVTALDPASGAAKWEYKGDGPGYASPIVIQIGAVRHLVTLTNKSVLGLDAATGKPLWTVPFPDEWHENIVTPVWTGSELIVSGIRQGTRAFKLAQAGGTWTATELWKNADVTMYMSSPVAGDGVLYGLSAKRKGQFVALDVKTGTTKWASEGREGEQASILLAPRHVLFLTNVGALVVANRTAAGFTEEKRYDVSDNETWTTPVFLGNAILVRDATSLVRLDGK